eukprot:2720573-Alexandrium_andersonii.AAC.1
MHMHCVHCDMTAHTHTQHKSSAQTQTYTFRAVLVRPGASLRLSRARRECWHRVLLRSRSFSSVAR